MDHKQFSRFVDHWSPGFGDEELELRLMRALMNAVACVASQREVMAGKEPLRPLSSFPFEAYPKGGIGL